MKCGNCGRHVVLVTGSLFFENADVGPIVKCSIQKKISLTHLITDVARPDKISGADINAICQEVNI